MCAAAISRPRVLVAEDDEDFRRLLTCALQRSCLVYPASSGLEAFSLALAHRPDVALVDLNMPGWGGFRLMREFQQHKRLAYLPVIVITGEAERECVVQAISLGARDFIVKQGFSKFTLAEKMQRILNQRVAMR